MRYESADLHMHTKNSDGDFSKNDLEEKICNIPGKKLFSITDHNYLTIKEPYDINGNFCIPGIEISAVANGEPVHILGYSMEPKVSSGLQKTLDNIIEGYQNRAEKIHKKIVDHGFNIPPLPEIRDPELPKPIQKTDFVKQLGKISGLKDSREIRDRSRKNGNLLFVEEEVFFPEVNELIPLMKESNFITVWAHPGSKLFRKNEEQNKSLNILNYIINSGIDGLEVFYYNHNSEQINILYKMANDNNLIITGGGDFHGIGEGELYFPLNGKYIESFLQNFNI